MANAFFQVPPAKNEPVLGYAPGSPERSELKATLADFKSRTHDCPMYINGEWVRTDDKRPMHPPHELKHLLGHYHHGDREHVDAAINAALAVRPTWEAMPWYERAAIFLKAADLISGPYRAKLNAATMLGQSKNAYQAEIDAVAELCDFLRFNVRYMTEIYHQQPGNADLIWNRMEYRGLEGFVVAITPFNFTAIAGNLPSSAAMMGNVVVWKPAHSQIFAAKLIMDIFHEAGLPAGVINLIYVDGPVLGDIAFSHRDFAGLHFTGSTGVFQQLWKTIGNNIAQYRAYPRIVGETGGKDFVIAHPTGDAEQIAVGLVRAAYEFQGQKCSAASRAYIPRSLWPAVKERLLADIATLKMGTVEDFSNFVNAVIDERAFDKIAAYIDQAKKDEQVEIIAGGGHDKSEGYFIEPTVILTRDPRYVTMEEEIFGPVLTVYIYEDEAWLDTLELLDETSPYALTGAVFARDRAAVLQATERLRHAAGNFYINDKPTGSIVGQQPFGGARGSGTNDKAGSVLNLYRWVSARTIKENFVAARDYRYPFLGEE